MTTAFLYLVACSAKNRVLARLRRLRQPRYLLGAVAGGLYFYWAFVRQQMRTGVRRGAPSGAAMQRFAEPLAAGGALLLGVAALYRWIVPPRRPPLRFTAAEAHVLFTAPIPRRALVQYKLLRSQLGVLFGVAVGLFFGWAAAGPNRLSFLLGGWILFATLQMHLMGIALNRASLVEPGGRRRLRSWLPLVVTVAASVVLLLAFARSAISLAGGGPASGSIVDALLQEARSGVAGAVLWPVTLVVRPVFAAWPWDFARAAWPALVLLLLNYLWVVGSDARLEESAIASERQRSEGKAAAPAQARRLAPFALDPAGRPEVAILWKNLLMIGRYASPRTIVRLAAPLVILAVAIGSSSRPGVGFTLAPIFLVLAGVAAVLGPQMARNDLRADLGKLGVLKTWPLSGEAIVTGELLAPLVVITALGWTALVLATLVSLRLPIPSLGTGDRVALAIAAMMALPPFALLQLVIQNGVAVLFPGWIPTGERRARGIEAMGQQMLLLAATAVLLVLGLLPAAVVAGVLAVPVYWLAGWLAAIPAAAVLGVVLTGEVWLAVRALGRVFERTDPAAVEAAE